MACPTLTRFSMRLPAHRTAQGRGIDWLADLHAAAQAALEKLSLAERDAFASRMRKAFASLRLRRDEDSGFAITSISRSAAATFDELPIYDVLPSTRIGKGTAARGRLYAETVDAYFEAEYAREPVAPRDIVHVTCTGYVSPSGGQKLVQRRGWHDTRAAPHAHHMEAGLRRRSPSGSPPGALPCRRQG